MPDTPIILASKSVARKAMLEDAGLSFECVPADIDEQKIIDELQEKNFSAAAIALELAKKKSAHVAKSYPDAVVIGADQVLQFEGGILSKAESEDDAREKLKLLRGKTHRLISAVCITKGETGLWQHIDEAELSMHDFDDAYLERYISKAGVALTRAVGGYELESGGSWLFSSVKGDFFTVLGMPLLPLLGYLREYHKHGP